MTFTEGQLHTRNYSHQSLKWVWKLDYLKFNSCLSRFNDLRTTNYKNLAILLQQSSLRSSPYNHMWVLHPEPRGQHPAIRPSEGNHRAVGRPGDVGFEEMDEISVICQSLLWRQVTSMTRVLQRKNQGPIFKDQSRYAPCQWATSLHCNDVSHWLGAYLDWTLHFAKSLWTLHWNIVKILLA